MSDYWRCVGDTVENGVICIDDTKKTGEPIFISMHWQVKEILSKYEGKLHSYKETSLNVHLKKLGEKAGLNNLVKDTRPHKNGTVRTILAVHYAYRPPLLRYKYVSRRF